MMDELISKEAVFNAINRIKTKRNETWYEFYQKIMIAVGKIPSAQPEIIYCKDCKHREYYRESGYMCRLDTGDPYMTGRNAEDDDWFCADAERKDDE